MRSEKPPLILRRRSVLAGLSGVSLAAIVSAYGARGQGQTAVPTAGGAVPATYTGGIGTETASSVPNATVPPPMTTPATSPNAAGSGALSTTAAMTTPITGGSGTMVAPASMGPTPTHITGIGPLPKPLPTQGGAQPTIVGAAPPAAPAGAANPSASATPAPAMKVTITADRKFDPPQVTVNKGDIIQWVNMSRSPQTVTDDPVKAVDRNNAGLPMGAQPWSSGALNTGSPYMKVFDVPGDYTYFSIPGEGQGLVGRITVKG